MKVREIYRFTFAKPVDRTEVEDDVCLAIFCAQCIHGQPRVRLDVGGFLVSADGSKCVLDVRGWAGEAAARIFTGLSEARIGGESLKVERLPQEATAARAGEPNRDREADRRVQGHSA